MKNVDGWTPAGGGFPASTGVFSKTASTGFTDRTWPGHRSNSNHHRPVNLWHPPESEPTREERHS